MQLFCIYIGGAPVIKLNERPTHLVAEVGTVVGYLRLHGLHLRVQLGGHAHLQARVLLPQGGRNSCRLL